ncbi:helix-turn-helix transcriptional regulator [Castellaniella sp.]|uniref:helix-turn-helix transcriptional regulator n=1 Tax=Castellaniella sp. TaxID=1955812 RepID=UPI0035619316
MTMTSTLTAQFPQPPTSTTLLYRICVAERKLGVSRSTIYRLVNEGQLELVKIGKRSSRITAVSLDALIERCREPA